MSDDTKQRLQQQGKNYLLAYLTNVLIHFTAISSPSDSPIDLSSSNTPTKKQQRKRYRWELWETQLILDHANESPNKVNYRALSSALLDHPNHVEGCKRTAEDVRTWLRDYKKKVAKKEEEEKIEAEKKRMEEEIDAQQMAKVQAGTEITISNLFKKFKKNKKN